MGKFMLIIIAVMVMAMMMFGCQSDKEAQKGAGEMTEEVQGEAATAEETPAEAAEEAVDTREGYIAKVEQQLQAAATQLTAWKDQVASLPVASQPMAETSLNAVQTAHDGAMTALGTLKDADPAEWQNHVPAVDEAMSGLDAAMQSAKELF